MAESKSAANPKDLDLCYLCSQPFSDPKLLPCLHSFCAKCLTKHCTDQGESRWAVCPTCSTSFTVPERGFSSLPTNSLAKRVVELKRVTSQVLATCDACLENEGNSPAKVYCQDCEQHLCAACSNIHKRLKASSSHSVLSIDNKKPLNLEDLVKNRVEMCSRHPQERAILYCSNCWELICTICFVAEHSKHACHDAHIQAGDIRNKLKDSVELLSARSEWYKSEREELRAEKQKFITGLLEAQKGVRDKAQEARRLIDEQQNELLAKLEQLKDEKLTEVGRAETWFGTSTSSVEYCLQFVLDVLSKGSEGDVVGLFGDINRRLEVLLKDQPMPVNQEEVTFQASPQLAADTNQQKFIGGIFAEGPNARKQTRHTKDHHRRFETRGSRCLLQNPLGQLVTTSTVSNRRN